MTITLVSRSGITDAKRTLSRSSDVRRRSRSSACRSHSAPNLGSVALRNLLDVLLDDAGRLRAEEAAESWAGVSQYVENNCQLEEDYALAASLLLAKDKSLLHFIRKSLEQQGAAPAQ